MPGRHGSSTCPPAVVGTPEEQLSDELKQRITKVASFIAAKPQFEATLRAKESSNPRFAFLFGGEGSAFFQAQLAKCRGSHSSGSEFVGGSSDDTISKLIKRVTSVSCGGWPDLPCLSHPRRAHLPGCW